MIATTLSAGDDISAPLSAYTSARQAMRLPNALMGGTAAMRAAGKDYLFQETGETPEKYQARIDRSVLFEAYGRTIEKLVGEMFKEKISVSEDVADDVKDWLKDIDRQGNDITSFMVKAMTSGTHEGIVHILVDYPQSPGQTVEDHKKVGAQPYLVMVKSESLIGWRLKSTPGGSKLVQARIAETHTVPDGLYGQKEVERIRLLTPGAWEVHEKGERGWAIAVDEDGNEMKGTTNLSFIPMVTVWLGEPASEMTSKPPLMPLAYLNCAHWQSSSDQKNILHYARLVTWFGKMIDQDENGKVLMGANRLITSDSPDGDLKVVEHSGAAIEAGRQDLEDLKTEMALFGLSLLIGKTGTVTATEKGIDKGENDSALYGFVRALNSSLEQIFEYMHKYLNREVKGEVKANDDFSGLLDRADNALLIKAFESELLPRSVVIDELKARGVLKTEIDLVDVISQLEEDQKTKKETASLSGPPQKTTLPSLQA